MLNYFYKIASICIFLSLRTDDVLVNTRYAFEPDPEYWDTNQGPPPVSVFIEIETNQNFSTERGIAFDLIIKNNSSREYLIRNPLDDFSYYLFCEDVRGIEANGGTPRYFKYTIIPITDLSRIIWGVTIKSGHLNGRKLSHREIVPSSVTLPAQGEYKYSLVFDRLHKGAAFQTGKYNIIFSQSIMFRNGEFSYLAYDKRPPSITLRVPGQR